MNRTGIKRARQGRSFEEDFRRFWKSKGIDPDLAKFVLFRDINRSKGRRLG